MGKVSEYALKSIDEAVEAARYESAEYVSPYITTDDAEAIARLIREVNAVNSQEIFSASTVTG